MEIKRLYDHEIRFLKIIILCLVALLGIASFFILSSHPQDFEDYLKKRDYQSLYKSIEKPDFSMDIFTIYMDYNYGENIRISEVTKSSDKINYRVNSSNGEKEIRLVNMSGKYKWIFDDYVNDWTLSINRDAKVTLQNIPMENIDGSVIIKRIPFAVYELAVEMDNCNPYRASIMAGQNIEIKLSLSNNVIDICTGKVHEYLSFKEDAINNGKIRDISCVDKNSGVYTEVIDEMEMSKTLDYKIIKKINGIKVTGGIIDSSGMVCLSVTEQWEVSINNNGKNEKKLEELKHRYFMDQNSAFKIVGIKTNQD